MGVGAYPIGGLFGPTGPMGPTGPSVTGAGGPTGPTGSIGTNVAAKIHATATTAAGGGGVQTRILFDTTDYNDGGFTIPTSGGRPSGITVPSAGLYEITAQLGTIANSQTCQLYVYVNGTPTLPDGSVAEDFIGATFSNGAFVVGRGVKIPVKLSAGDTVELYFAQATAAGQAAQAQYTWLAVTKVQTGPVGATGPTGPANTGGGAPLAYTEFTATVTVSAVTEAGANTVVTAGAITATGVDPIMVEFYSPAVVMPGSLSAQVILVLYDGAASIGVIGQSLNPSGSGAGYNPVLVRRKLTPSAGSHTYSIRAYAVSPNGEVRAGVGGLGIYQPGYIKIDNYNLAGPTGPVGATGPTGPSLQPLTMTAKSANYSAVSGDYVVCTGSFSVTLPAATAGRVVGVKAASGQTGAAPVTIATLLGAAQILGKGVVASATSILLGIPGANVTLEADGTNWHIIDGAQDSGWIGLPYAGAFSDYGSGYQLGQYRKIEDIVHLRGLTKFTPSGVYGAGSMGVTLPAGYRPSGIEIFHVMGSSTTDYHFRIDIDTAGAITRQIIQGGNWDGNYMSYAAIEFSTA